LLAPKAGSDRMQTPYDILAKYSGFHESHNVWLYRPTSKKGKSLKRQSSWEGEHKVVTWTNDVYKNWRNPRLSIIMVHLDLHPPYQGTARDDQF
jgi:hypothetical protein